MASQELNKTASEVEQAQSMWLARILVQTDALLGALKQHGKLGRYVSDFPEKPYFLFSQCARLLYDFEIARQDYGLCTAFENAHLAHLLDQLDFGRLRQFDCARQGAIPTSGQQFKNESEWYRFWFEVIEATGHLASRELAGLQQSLLECVGAHGVLIAKLDKSTRKTVARQFGTATAGRLMVQSEWVLEDVSGEITSWLAGLSARAHVLAQVQSLVCALRQIRRHIVWHAAATGPYTLSPRVCWGMPPGLARYRFRGRQGQLTVALQDEGGSIRCQFEQDNDHPSEPVSWSTNAGVLQGNYEKALFETWAYDTGVPTGASKDAQASSAQWNLGSVEAGYLEFVSQRAEMLTKALARHAPSEPLVIAVGRLLEEGADGRRAGHLRWAYVREMDLVVRKLESTWRQPLPDQI